MDHDDRRPAQSDAGDPWFHDDAFWNAVEPVLFGSVRNDDARSEVAHIVEALDLAPPATVLDVFCGPGRHLVPLYQLGFRVIGVDRTLRFVRAALQELAEVSKDSPSLADPVVVQHKIGGSAALPLDTTGVEVADCALWLGASAGYDGIDGDARTLFWIRQHLRRGALLLIEGPVAEDLTAAPFARWEWFDEGSQADGHVIAVWRLEHTLTDDGWLSGRWTRYQDGAWQRHRFRYQVHSIAEWSDILSQTGFTLVQRTSNLADLKGAFEGGGTGDPDSGTSSLSDEAVARSWLLARAD